MIGQDAYLTLLRDLLSGDSVRVRAANRRLYGELMFGEHTQTTDSNREADLILAEVPGG